MHTIEEDIERILISEKDIKKAVKKIGKQISKDYDGKNLMLVAVLKGSVIFMADLMREITVPCEIDFMCVSSYQSGTTSTGAVKIIKDLDINLEGKDVLIVEDILDSGRTLSYLKSVLMTRNPRSFRICTLLDKPERRVVDFKADMSLFTIPDHFVIGYGLDCGEYYRNLPYIAEYDA